MSPFQSKVRETLTLVQIESLKGVEMLGSPHRRTKIFNDPSIATNSEVLLFSELLGVHPYDLLLEFGLGKEGLTDFEKEYWKAQKSQAHV